MKDKLIGILVLFLLYSFLSVEASPHNITVQSSYDMVEKMETPDSAKQKARNIALKEAVEQAGIYVESYTKVSNYQLVKDEINVVACSNMKVISEDYEIQDNTDNMTKRIFCKLTVTIDNDGLDLKARMADKKALEESAQQYALLQDKFHNLMMENESLKKRFLSERGTTNEAIIMRDFEKNGLDLQLNSELEKATILIEQRNYTDAIELLDQLIGEFPESDSAYNLRGVVSFRKKLYPEAIEKFNKAISLNSGIVWYYNNLALAYMGNKQFEKGLANINKAIDLGGKTSWIYLNRGHIHSSLGNVQQAIDDFSTAISLDHNYANAYCDRGTEYLNIGNPTAALNDFNQAIAINPYDPQTWCNRGIVYCSQKNYQQAYEDFTKCLNLKPDVVIAYHNRGISLFCLKRFPEAIKDFDLRNHLKPDSIAYLVRGMCYSNLNDFTKAISSFDESIKLNNNNLRAHLFKAQLCNKLGRINEATTEYQEVLRINPTNKEARTYLNSIK